MLSEAELDEIVFQVVLTRMPGKQHYRKEILESTMVRLCQSAQCALDRDPLLLRLAGDLAIVGDIHGNIDDLLRIFERLRYPPSTRYLFLGDYVDRGKYSTEVLMILFAMKVKFPNHVYLLRGNHETESLTRCYGFYQEITAKYSSAAYKAAIQAFSSLPLCAVVGDCIFCVHGGISPLLSTLGELERLPKPTDFSRPGLFTDMVWSDPSDDIDNFSRNPRGSGCLYGPGALSSFLGTNNLDLLIRSHEACEDGTSWPFQEHPEACEYCVTVFSTSNYCDQGNTAAVIFVGNDMLVNVEVFPAVMPEDMPSQRIVLPYWLSDLITQKKGAHTKLVKVDAVPLRSNENENRANTVAGRV
jgi:protein phosphatase